MTRDDPDRQSREHDEELLRALLCGDLSEDDERARTALAGSEWLRSEWEMLRQMQSRLKEEDRERDEVLDEIKSAPSDAHEADLVNDFRRIATTQPRPRSAPTRWAPVLLVAAAAAVLVGIWLPWSKILDRAPRQPGETLGNVARIELIAPLGPVTEYQRLVWKPPPVAVGFYRISIFRKSESGELVEVELTSKLRESSYAPERPMPPRIVWRVVGLDRFGNVVARGEGEAWLVGR